MNEDIMNGLKEVLKLVRPNLDSCKVTPDSLLREDLGLDSLTLMLMSLGIENKFNIRFDETPVLNKVQDVIDYIAGK